MTTRKAHWPTRSPFRADRPSTEHLISERTLRERINQITERYEDREELRAELDTAIRQSRIS